MRRMILLLCGATALAVAQAHRPQSVGAAVIGTSLGVSALGECDVRCSHPGDCPSDWHDAWDDEDPNAMRNGGAHIDYQCRSGTCDVKHGPLCGGDHFAATDLELLRGALAVNNVGRATSVLRTHGTQTLVNVERLAVQVVDCNGVVVAHLPVPVSMVKALVARGVTTAPIEVAAD
jgi:hypothetical protein